MNRFSQNHLMVVQKSIESLYQIQDTNRLIDAILKIANDLTHTTTACLVVYDNVAKDFVAYTNRSDDQASVKALIKVAKDNLLQAETCQPYIVINHFHLFPFQQNEESFGMLAISSETCSLSQKESEMMRIFVQSLPILLENSKLYLIMKRKTKSLNVITSLLGLINRYPLQDIAAEIVKKVCAIMDTDFAGITLFDRKAAELDLPELGFVISDRLMVEKFNVSFHERSVVKHVFTTGVPMLSNNVLIDPAYYQLAGLFNVNAVITVPLTANEKRIGVMLIMNKEKSKNFTEVDVQSLMEISKLLDPLFEGALQLSQPHAERYEIDFLLTKHLVNLLLFSNYEEKQEEIEKIGHLLQFDLATKKSVMLVKFQEKLKNELERYEHEILKKITETIPNSLTSYKEGVFCMIVAHEQKEDIEQYSYLLKTTLNEFVRQKFKQQAVPDFYIGIGEQVNSSEELQLSYQQAKQILTILPYVKMTDHIGYYPKLSSWTLLTYLAGNQEITRPFVQHYLEKVNQRKDGDLIKETLESYLNHNGQLKKAAENLFVHPNTIKYRIEKFQDITGFDLLDPEIRLNLILALRLEKMLIDL